MDVSHCLPSPASALPAMPIGGSQSIVDRQCAIPRSILIRIQDRLCRTENFAIKL